MEAISSPHLSQCVITGRIQFKVLPSCLAKSSDFGSALFKYYANVQVFFFKCSAKLLCMYYTHACISLNY